MGLSNTTLGFSNGITFFVMPQLMAAAHVPEPKIAAITALASSPGFWFVFFAPILDVRFSRRWYATVLAALSGAAEAVAVLSLHHLLVLQIALVIGGAALSLILASVGLYGVLSYLATQRTAEIGVRMALGAQREEVLRLMLGDGLRPALYGLTLGLAARVGAVRLIQSMLYGTRPLDPAIFVAVAATLLVVAVFACLVPAWRASRIDPMQALRTE
jgi:ABC-type antimicrobial peptide transport system permease subunit